MPAPWPLSGHTEGSAQAVPLPQGPSESPARRPRWQLPFNSCPLQPGHTSSPHCEPLFSSVLGGIPDPANTDLVFPKLDLFIYSPPPCPPLLFSQPLMLGASWGHCRGGGRGSVFASPFVPWLGGLDVAVSSPIPGDLGTTCLLFVSEPCETSCTAGLCCLRGHYHLIAAPSLKNIPHTPSTISVDVQSWFWANHQHHHHPLQCSGFSFLLLSLKCGRRGGGGLV